MEKLHVVREFLLGRSCLLLLAWMVNELPWVKHGGRLWSYGVGPRTNFEPVKRAGTTVVVNGSAGWDRNSKAGHSALSDGCGSDPALYAFEHMPCVSSHCLGSDHPVQVATEAPIGDGKSRP